MSGAWTGRFALSEAEIKALARERERLSLCATADTLAARQGRLADRAARLSAAFGVADLAAPSLGTTDRGDVESLRRFVANATEVLGRAERQLTERFAQLRRQAVRQSMGKVADRARSEAGPRPASDRAPRSAAASTASPSAPPVDRTQARDIEAATDLLASLDDRVSDTSIPEHIAQEIRSAPASRRHLLLSALAAEVRDANEQVRQHAEVGEALTALAARAGQLDAPASEEVEVVAAAVAAHTAGQPVDLARVEATVSRAELVQEQRARLERARALVAAEFAARGYTVLPGAEVFTTPFGLFLQSDAYSDYGIGVDVNSDTVVFTTVRLVDDSGEQRTSHGQTGRERTCRVIGEVSAEISGMRIHGLAAVGEDVELLVPASARRRRAAATPVAQPRADQASDY